MFLSCGLGLRPWTTLFAASSPVLGATCTAVASMLSIQTSPSSLGGHAGGAARQQPRRCVATKAGKPAGEQRSASRVHQPRLSHVDGLGKKYEALLQQHGITTVEQLAERVLDRLGNQQAAGALTFLKEMGIRRIDHQQKIVTYIQTHYGSEAWASSTAAAAAATAAAGGRSPTGCINPNMLTFCVEGNISAGKSTFLQYITEQREGREALAMDTKVVPEPVDQWQDVKGPSGRLNLLSTFYENPERYAYPFQNFVFLTRVMAERDSADAQAGVRLMERSVFSDRMVFVRTVQESGWMGDVELAVYDSWFDPILNSQPSLLPNGFIYLRADPSVCMDRLKKRNRAGEDAITMQYLEGLHQKHEDWLWGGMPAQQWLEGSRNNSSSRGSSLAAGASSNLVGLRSGYPSGSSSSSNGSGLLVPQPPALQVPGNIASQLYFLQKSPALPELLDGTPALVLDCNPDVLHSEDLKAEFQDKVLSYITFTKQVREQRQAAGAIPHHSSSSSRGLGLGQVVPVSPGAPASGDMQQHVENVQALSRECDTCVIPANSGTVRPAGAVLQHEGVSGSLEALHMAAAAAMAGEAERPAVAAC